MSFVAKCPHCGKEEIADDAVAGSAITCKACEKIYQAVNPIQVVVVKLKPSKVSQAASILGMITILVPFLNILTFLPSIICGIIGLCTAKPGTGSVNRSLVGIIAPIVALIIGIIFVTSGIINL